MGPTSNADPQHTVAVVVADGATLPGSVGGSAWGVSASVRATRPMKPHSAPGAGRPMRSIAGGCRPRRGFLVDLEGGGVAAIRPEKKRCWLDPRGGGSGGGGGVQLGQSPGGKKKLEKMGKTPSKIAAENSPGRRTTPPNTNNQMLAFGLR